MPQPLITEICLKIICLIFHSSFPGANELREALVCCDKAIEIDAACVMVLFHILSFQDFEDWDDVGLNMPKPPDLVHLYRDFGQHALPGSEKMDVECMVDLESEDIREREEVMLKVQAELVRECC